MKSEAKIGFWTGIGFLGALLVWNFLASKIPAISQYSGGQ